MRAVGLCASKEGAWGAAFPGQIARSLIRPSSHEHEPRCQLPLLWQQALTTPAPGQAPKLLQWSKLTAWKIIAWERVGRYIIIVSDIWNLPARFI